MTASQLVKQQFPFAVYQDGKILASKPLVRTTPPRVLGRGKNRTAAWANTAKLLKENKL